MKRSSNRSAWIRVGWFSLRGLFLIHLLIFAGCASNGSLVRKETVLVFTPEQREALSRMDSAPYRLQRSDHFAVQFMYHEELNQSDVMILPDGTSTFFGLDQITVAGLSVAELDSILTARYGDQYVNPDLAIIVHSIGGRQVYVMGEVRQPGLHDLPPVGISVPAAIALAGGFNDHAGKGSVVQIRITPDGYLSRELDLSSLHKGGEFDVALLDLQPYDILYVSRSWIGDLAFFTENIIGSLLDYTRMALDIRLIETPGSVWRK